MSRTIEVDSDAVKEYEDSRKGFDALPAGTYDFTVKQIDEIKYAKEGPNARPALNVQLRVPDDWPVGAGRVFFYRVPLFHKFAPSGKPGAKYPDGAPAFAHFQFYEALGVSKADVAAGRLPDDRELLGKRLAGKLVVKPADQHNDAPHNEVSSVFPSKTVVPPAGERVIAGDLWATPAPVPTAAPVADPWAVTPADVQGAQELAAAAATGQGF